MFKNDKIKIDTAKVRLLRWTILRLNLPQYVLYYLN